MYVGSDIAADTFTAAWLPPGGAPSVPFTGEQTSAGFATLQRRLQATAVPSAETLPVLEATDNDWVALAVALHEAGYRVAVVNPRQAHHFAKAQLRRAKTDALDARDLARLAAALHPAPWVPPPTVYHEARQRLVARDALLAMRTQVRNQRHALLHWPVVVAGVRQHPDELISDLDRSVASLEAEHATLRSTSAWAESLACLTSAPGIGHVTAAWLLVRTRNFALCTNPCVGYHFYPLPSRPRPHPIRRPSDTRGGGHQESGTRRLRQGCPSTESRSPLVRGHVGRCLGGVAHG